ncbi:MAG: hypothetical protein R3286_18420, partial [Gammaproteobacteria bacterium]|nr:hypothetical protein [Gammaproteobacteria bacterium]
EGGFGVRYLEGSRFEFTRPDGTVIEHCPTLDSAESSQHADIESFNRTYDLDIDAGTCVSRWDGTQMDMNLAILGLLYDDARGGDSPG